MPWVLKAPVIRALAVAGIAALAVFSGLLLGTRLWPWLPLPRLHAAPPLPEYRLELTDRWEEHLPHVGALSVRRASPLAITARPAEPVSGPVTLRTFLARDGAEKPWAVHFEQTHDGAFVLRRRVAELPGLDQGEAVLTLIVARPWAAPQDAAEARRRGPSDEIRVLEADVTIENDNKTK